MSYVDGYVIPIRKKNLAAYRAMARRAAAVWREHGAIEFRECAGDDLGIKYGMPFPKLCRLKPGETALFSWIVYKSRAHRDRVNAKVMKDPRIAAMVDPAKMPFDMARMSVGGFKVLVDA